MGLAVACAGGEDASSGGGNGGGSAAGGTSGTGAKEGGTAATAAKDGGGGTAATDGGGDVQTCDNPEQEVCDGQDNDCDGKVDEEDATDAETWYEDKDGDGYGIEGKTTKACDQPKGYGNQPGDCNDNDPAYRPGALENNCDDPNDYNCDGKTGYVDSDGDGFPACKECDDGDKNVYPGAKELCDGKDDDCDGKADYPGGESDNDGDGAIACEDCDDKDKDRFPGNPEVCDGKDNDCNGTADFPPSEADQDGDGVPVCKDCDDNDKNNYPGNTEICDAKDNDCNGKADFPGGEVDNDNDKVANCLDCDDNDPARFPGNPEKCDGKDNDCNATTWATGGETDGDGDGVAACLDCNDNDPANFPGNSEKCDGKDNNCVGGIDQAEVPVSILCPNGTNVSQANCNGPLGCVIQTCTSGYYDVNATFSDGCECQASPTGTQGNSCSNAINMGNLADVSGAAVTAQGNVPYLGREIWYSFNATDDVDTAGDEFHVDVRFPTGGNPGNGYRMDVYRKACPGSLGSQQIASSENQQTDWRTDFPTKSAGCTDTTPLPPCGQGDCTATPVSGINTCSDDGATFYVKITNVGSPTCDKYTLEMSNGKYKTP